jgi:mannose-6-phosphate isomerase-like protein (cupin superfamily)
MRIALTSPVLVLALVFAPSVALSQKAPDLYMPGVNYKLPGVMVTAAQIETMKKNMLAKSAIDVPINMVEMGGHQAGLSLVIRKGPSAAPVLHDLVSEVYHVYEGSGTFHIGGELVNPTRRAASRGNGPGLNGTDVKGGQQFKLSKGDVLFVPAGTVHRFISSDNMVVYTVTRMDRTNTTPLQTTSTEVPDTSNLGAPFR